MQAKRSGAVIVKPAHERFWVVDTLAPFKILTDISGTCRVILCGRCQLSAKKRVAYANRPTTTAS